MESAYVASLPVRERRLAGRLEGFGDIIFGFAVSQCALQLPTVHGHVDLSRTLSLLAYFGTFAVLASFWLTYHRVMSESFRPTRFDLLLAFGYLAFVSLMPFAMYSITHERESFAAARSAIEEYVVLFGVVLLVGATMTLRNLRRGWYFMSDDDRDFTWRGFKRRVSLMLVMCIALSLDLTVGPIAGSCGLFLLFIAPGLSAMVFSMVPSPARLRIPAPPIGNA